VDKQLLSRIARQGSGKLVDTVLGKGLTGKIAGAALTRLATRSVPGAIVVGGGILAKLLYDRRKARKGKAGRKDG
jgi:hypothetical protein